MIRKFQLAGLLVTTLLTCSCTTLYWQEGLRTPEPAFHEEQWRNEFFFGLWESQGPLELQKICGSPDFATVRVRKSPLQVLIGMVTVGIYTPNSVSVLCKTELSQK